MCLCCVWHLLVLNGWEISVICQIFLSGSLTSKSFYFTTVLCKLEELNYVNCMVALRLTKQIINCWSGSITNVK